MNVSCFVGDQIAILMNVSCFCGGQVGILMDVSCFFCYIEESIMLFWGMGPSGVLLVLGPAPTQGPMF